MILKKDFYFMRHGETDLNLVPPTQQGLYPDVGLNSKGKVQATAIAALLSKLLVSSICFSPLKRAKETKEISCKNLQANQFEIPSLRECDFDTWKQMRNLGRESNDSGQELVRKFFQRVVEGINEALRQKGPVLIIAHGGVFLALSRLMELDLEEEISHCYPVHLSWEETGWKIKKLC